MSEGVEQRPSLETEGGEVGKVAALAQEHFGPGAVISYRLNQGGFVNHSFSVETPSAALWLKVAGDPGRDAGLEQWVRLASVLAHRYLAPEVLQRLEIGGKTALAFPRLDLPLATSESLEARMPVLVDLLVRLHADEELSSALAKPSPVRTCPSGASRSKVRDIGFSRCQPSKGGRSQCPVPPDLFLAPHGPNGVRRVLAGYDLSTDRLYGHVKTTKGRTQFVEFCRYLRTLHPPKVRIAIVLDNFSPHLATNNDIRVGDRAAANNVELAYVPFYAGSTASRASSPPCATSPSTARTTPPIAPRHPWSVATSHGETATLTTANFVNL